MPPAGETPPPHRIRLMTPADLKIVCQIDRDAFEAYHRQQRRLNRPLPLRTAENMNAAIRRPLPGVVVESPPGRVVGYCFTHIWGTMGWLGTLGVTPGQQGFGLGRAVIAAGLDLLREAGCTTLALETMPESGKNLALYSRLGLNAQHLTCVFQGAIRAAPHTTYERWTGSPAVREIAGRLVPGLDVTPAARWLEDEEGGQTFVWREGGQPVAFAAVRTSPRRMETAQSYLNIEVAGCLPEAAHLWPQVLAELQAQANRQQKLGLVIPVSTQQTHLTRALLDLRLEISYTRVRMAAGEPLGAPDALLMLTLAM